MNPSPSVEQWLSEAKTTADAAGVGMYLIHNGVVRGHSRGGEAVAGMGLSVDRARLAEVLAETEGRDGIAVVKAWVNEGDLRVGDDIMYVLVGGDIREHVFDALMDCVRAIKSGVVTEVESRP